MAKVNGVGMSGAALSLVTAGTFWMIALMTSVWGSGMSEFEMDARALMVPLAAAYTVGTLVGLLSQLGAFLQLPSLTIGLMITWYVDSPPAFYLVYVGGLLGASLLIISMFIEYSIEGKAFKTPPFSRFMIWTIRPAEPGAEPLSSGMERAIIASLIACAVAVAGFAAYSWSSGVSDLRVEFVTDGTLYGSVNVSVSIDGEEVYAAFIPYDPEGAWIISTATLCPISAGTHLIEIDTWNGEDLVQGTVDAAKNVRVLPFTSDSVLLGLGVAFT